SAVQAKIDEILAQKELIIDQALSSKATKRAQREGKPTDAVKQKNVRPNIFSIAISGSEPLTIEFCISHGSREHLKPTEILKLLAPGSSWQIARTALLTDDGRGIFEASVPPGSAASQAASEV